MIDLKSSLSSESETRGNGEPEWMPSLAEVARARIQMERQGIVQSVSRGVAAPELVAPGETPWLWWGAALAWVIVWPAIIALRLSGQPWLAWLPLWLPLILALIHMLVLAGPVLLTERGGDKEDIRRRFTKIQTVAQMLALEPSEFEAWSAMLFTLLGYRVTDTQHVADHGIDLEVSNARVRRGLVQCKRYRGTVGEPMVRDLYGTLVHENADFGWLVTTAGVSRQARDWAAGKPLELWDGQKLVEFARSFRLS